MPRKWMLSTPSGNTPIHSASRRARTSASRTSIPATHVGSRWTSRRRRSPERGSEWLAMEQEILYALACGWRPMALFRSARNSESGWSLQPTRQRLPDRLPWTRTSRRRRAIKPDVAGQRRGGWRRTRREADLLKRIAEQKRATPAQIALTWLLVQRPWVVPIPGTTKLHRLEENIRAANVQLTANDLAEIERAASAITVRGERYPEQLMTTTGR